MPAAAGNSSLKRKAKIEMAGTTFLNLFPLSALYWQMKHLTLDIPDMLDIDDAEAAMHFAAMLYEQGKLSLGQAADLSHFPKRTFAERLGTYNVSYLII